MTAIVPFDFNAPTAAVRRPNSRNAEVIIHSTGFASISIKGKVFAIVKGDERKPLMRMIDGDRVPVASLQLAVVRANTKSRVFYAKSYTEGDSDGAKPTCFSHDGQFPDPAAEAPQAKNCQLCPHAAWGSKVSTDGQGGKGTACTVNTRLAVIDAGEKLTEDKPKYTPYLLRVPAGSRANFNAAVNQIDAAGKDYNEAVIKISFDPEAPSPKLVFRPVGVLSEQAFGIVDGMFEDPVIQDIVGRPTVRKAEEVQPEQRALPPAAPAAPQLTADDVVDAPAPAPKPAPKAAPKPAPKPAPAPQLTAEDVGFGGDDETPAPAPAPRAPKAAPKPAPAVDTAAAASSLLGGLEEMLSMSDD